ncbi:cell surface glycoprotein 1-like isoform X2 [Ischnura elegans]|uniref:cell surface glycoprotein 1-like isoform X2 n=1 Tax=Ischnura elegans TaxID=197161 RepID=UPI001ED88780|nr:cell surface glycoprotein 1-like isoform X2 [Ischnura elegans]
MDRTFLNLLVIVALSLLPSGIFAIPIHEGIHSIQPPLNSPPTAPGADFPATLGHEHSASKQTLAEKVAAEIVADSPTIVVPKREDHDYDSTEKSVNGEGQRVPSDDGHDDYESVSESRKDEVPLFLEEEGERGWGLEDHAPRPPYFLQLGEQYEAEREIEYLHAPDGMPWLPPAISPAAANSPLHPAIHPSQDPTPSASEEPQPSDGSTPDSPSASPSQAPEGEEDGGRVLRDQSKQHASASQVPSTESPEVNPNPEGATTPSSSLSNLATTLPPSYVTTPSPSASVFYGSSPAPIDPESSSTPSPEHSVAAPSPSTSPSAPPEALPSLSSTPVPSDDPPLVEAVRGREGKAIGVSHVDQQPKVESKPTEGVAPASEPTGPTTEMPTKLDVDSSPEKSSSSINMSAVVEKEDQAEVGAASPDPKDPVLADSTHSNDNDKRDDKVQSSEVSSSSVIEEEVEKVVEPQVVIGPTLPKDVDLKSDESIRPSESAPGVGKPIQEEDGASAIEVPTAVAVREGGVSGENTRPEDKITGGGEEGEPPNDKVGKESSTTVVDVQSTVQQGRMTAPKALDAASIVGISLGSVLLVGAIAGGVGFVLYRRSLYANKPQTLNDKCSNPDSSGYIDDTLRVSSGGPPRVPRPMPRSGKELTRGCSQGRRGGGRGGGVGEGGRPQRPGRAKIYIQNKGTSLPEGVHSVMFPSPHENSEEMYSLDNDSFLNSLEAMTIQNYWTDSVKHTKL